MAKRLSDSEISEREERIKTAEAEIARAQEEAERARNEMRRLQDELREPHKKTVVQQIEKFHLTIRDVVDALGYGGNVVALLGDLGYEIDPSDALKPKKIETTNSAGRAKSGASAQGGSRPKYRNPNNPSETWTGHGRQPKFYKDAIAAGVSPDAMLIAG